MDLEIHCIAQYMEIPRTSTQRVAPREGTDTLDPFPSPQLVIYVFVCVLHILILYKLIKSVSLNFGSCPSKSGKPEEWIVMEAQTKWSRAREQHLKWGPGFSETDSSFCGSVNIKWNQRALSQCPLLQVYSESRNSRMFSSYRFFLISICSLEQMR